MSKFRLGGWIGFCCAASGRASLALMFVMFSSRRCYCLLCAGQGPRAVSKKDDHMFGSVDKNEAIGTHTCVAEQSIWPGHDRCTGETA